MKRYIKDIISDIFEQSLRAANKKAISEGEDLFSDSGEDVKKEKSTEDEEKEKVEPSDKKAENKEKANLSGEDKQKLESGNVTADDVIEKLNTIRSGKSFKDEEIMSKMSEYVDGLNKPEKTALLSFLKALSQIVTGEVAVADVVKPSEDPVEIKIEKEPDVKRRTIKPTVIKMQPKEEDKSKKTPAEDSKGPVPITAKQK